jgi:demethylmenaquinone methyltransferase/2-methoxy-6-polyprenyl-1,4-benzoquinol methylase
MTPESSQGRPLSKVEVTGAEARHYDLLMNVVTGGTYPLFIRRVVRDMGLRPGEAVLDLGSGTGRNATLMARHLGESGRVLGLDVGDEMLAQAQRRVRSRPDVAFQKRRIEEPLPFEGEFDVAFLSFVLHGFVQEARLRILDNVHRALRPGGRLLILDYEEQEPDEASWLVRLVFRAECLLATDFVRRDWKALLTDKGFGRFREVGYYGNNVRLLEGVKESGTAGTPSSRHT